MAERRSLIEGVKPAGPAVSPLVENAFVFGQKSPPEAVRPAPPTLSKSPISTRIRADFAAALKRASLQRQLDTVLPNTLQGILEEALEPWLKANGYIP